MLWGRAANRCAICKRELVVAATDLDREALVGDECHIISSRPVGPRYDPTFPASELDSHHNLILLCRNHHRLVDEQCRMYSVDALRGIKAAHETWVTETLQGDPRSRPSGPLRWRRKSVPEYLVRLTHGQELLALVIGCHGFSFGHDELQTEQEVELVGTFLQTAHEYGDFGDDLEPYRRVQASRELTESLEELELEGFIAFGGREVHVCEGGAGGTEDFVVAILRVFRETNDEVIRVNPSDAAGQPQAGETHDG